MKNIKIPSSNQKLSASQEISNNSKNLFIKVHHSHNTRPVVAICDSDILGKKIEEGRRQLDIRESFYKGEEVDKKKLFEIIKRQSLEDSSFNIAGKESIGIAIEAGIIKIEGVRKIKGIPFALVLL